MNRIFVTREIPAPGLEAMRKLAEVTVSPLDRDLTEEEIIRSIEGCNILVPTIANRITSALFDARKEIRLIANFGMGVDHIHLAAAKNHSVLVSNTPGALSETTADMAMALILAVTRRLVEGDMLVRSGAFRGISPLFMLGADLHGKSLGIYGLGRIGLALATRAKTFGMQIIYHNRNRNQYAEKAVDAKYVPFYDLLRNADIVSVNAPLTDQTRGVFNHKSFTLMRQEAFFVNTARGAIHIEADLVRALEERSIAGAALDVYEFEPQVHPRLLAMQNVVLSPHLGTATREIRAEMALTVAQNVASFLNGRDLPNRVV